MKKNIGIFCLLVFMGSVSSAYSNHACYNIRKATIADIDDLVELHYISWHATYDETLDERYVLKNSKNRLRQYWDKFFDKQKSDNRFVLVAQLDEEIVGLISAGPIKIDKNESKQIAALFGQLNYGSEIYKLYVLPSEQQKGIGTLLLRRSFDTLREYGLGNAIVRVFTQNENACNFYKRYGFEIINSIERSPDHGVEVPYMIYGLNG